MIYPPNLLMVHIICMTHCTHTKKLLLWALPWSIENPYCHTISIWWDLTRRPKPEHIFRSQLKPCGEVEGMRKVPLSSWKIPSGGFTWAGYKTLEATGVLDTSQCPMGCLHCEKMFCRKRLNALWNGVKSLGGRGWGQHFSYVPPFHLTISFYIRSHRQVMSFTYLYWVSWPSL